MGLGILLKVVVSRLSVLTQRRRLSWNCTNWLDICETQVRGAVLRKKGMKEGYL